jgi:hypothetical protein
MLQQAQARCRLKAPVRIAYWDGKRLRSVCEAVALDLPRTPPSGSPRSIPAASISR